MDRGGAVGDCAAAGVAGVFAGSVVLSRFAAGLRHRALKDAGVFRTVLGRVLIKSRLATAKCQCALWSTLRTQSDISRGPKSANTGHSAKPTFAPRKSDLENIA